MPIMSSGGTGLQQRAIFVSTPSAPGTSTPLSLTALRVCFSRVSSKSLTSTVGSSCCSPLYRSMRVSITCFVVSSFSPIARYMVATSFLCRVWATWVISSGLIIFCSGSSLLRMLFVSASRPRSSASRRRSFAKCWRIFVRAREERTNFSQSSLGPASSSFVVIISTVTPVGSIV